MITPIPRPVKPALPEIKYITFVSVMEGGGYSFKIKEDYYKRYGHYSQVIMVARCDIEGFEKGDYRLMGTHPCVLGNKDRGFEPEERRKSLMKFGGYPQFNFGQYYDLDCLLFMDDVIEYNNHRRKFEDIRSARDFVKQNEHRSSTSK